MYKAFSSVYSRDHHPKLLQTDKGKEFFNRKLQAFSRSLKIHNFSTEKSDIKASMAERADRTIKQKIFKYLLHNLTCRYIDALPALVDSYNSSVHRSIKMAPNQVTPEKYEEVAKNLYPELRPCPNTSTWSRGTSTVPSSRPCSTTASISRGNSQIRLSPSIQLRSSIKLRQASI